MLYNKYTKALEKYIKALVLFGAVVAGDSSCQKTETGFLSPNLFYVQNPLIAPQGSITVSSALQVDGSTTPLTVVMTKVVDSNGKSVDSMLAKRDSFPGFSGSVSYLDSNLVLLNKKLIYTSAPPLSVNSIGGRIQLTPATSHIPKGTYTIDIKATNVRGSVSIPNACKIVITSAGSPDTVYSGAYTGTLDNTTGAYVGALNNPSVAVQFIPSAVNKIVFKWIDKNGKVYNAATHGIGVRLGRWNFRNFDPYYPQVLTDTSVEYQYPTVPNEFPAFPNTGADGNVPRGTFGCFFKLPAAAITTGQSMFTFSDIAFFSQGLYIVTISLSDIAFN